MTILDELLRQKASELIQAALIAEADEFLGRIAGVPGKSATGYRDGYEEPRTVAYGSTPVTIRRPRVRASGMPFRSELLPSHQRRFPELDKAMHELWLQGLSTRDFEPSLRALVGETTPLSASSISRINAQFLDDYHAWCRRAIADEYVYIWADGVYLSAGAQDERRVMLTVVGVDTKGRKDLLAMEDAFGESAESWTVLFESLRDRGLRHVALLVADGAQGIWKAFSEVFPRAKQQRCWIHKMKNIEDKVPEKHRERIHECLTEAMHAKTRPDAERLLEKLAAQLAKEYPKAASCIREDVARLTAYYEFPKDHWTHLRTTNVIESNFDAVRLRTNACKRIRSAQSATYLVWALLLRRKSHWRRLNGYALLAQVHQSLVNKISEPIALRPAA
jgi:transposase-like protein